ncbi:MAG: flavodoxin-dependent (E)-4-hydroxy-3-methylbut-2-enyl-diphosphate synthase [Candidatus Aminicenantes bacterium]|nr:flavodoxin-dependent (E)-4-hydroxy-3-methylbut-2-enyl-diphosphate synthase [Candidatus Aminicenantes bacterium]
MKTAPPLPPWPRRPTRTIRIGGVPVGGGAPIAVQSMTKTDTRDAAATLRQVESLERAGCEIVRLAVPDRRAALALKTIKAGARLPLVADIHFDHRLALAALEAGVDGLRINPGNIGPKAKVREVVRAARERRVPIRIGVNAGSLEAALLRRHGGPTPRALVESALGHVRLLEDMGFDLIKISLKSSDAMTTLAAYRGLAEKVDYPFHAGITEAGGPVAGTAVSAVGLALLAAEGLADTIRVSLTAPPEEEVRVGYLILSALGLRRRGIRVVSCPTCGRTEIDLAAIAAAVEARLRGVEADLTVAVMGCTVNGPGEAKAADLGIACGRSGGALFRKGRLICRVPADRIVETVCDEASRLAAKKERGGR